MGRAPCCDKEKVKRGPWSPEEDAKLKEYIEKNGTGGNWIALPQKAGLRRCGKSCRLRWLNYLRPNIKHGDFSDQEDRIICSLYATIGSRWSIIAAQLPGRTDNDIKNYWNTKLKKKLVGIMVSPSSSSSSSPQKTRPNNNNYPIAPTLPDYSHQTHSITTPPPYATFLNPPPPPPPSSSSASNLVGPTQNDHDLVVKGCGYAGDETLLGDLQQSFVCNNGGSPLDYSSLEEIKQLISTNNISQLNNFFVEENTTDEEKLMMYY